MDNKLRSTKTILLVEDEPLIRMSVADFLIDQGYRVEEAGSRKSALERLKALEDSLGAVVLDLGLPDERGDFLVNEVRTVYPSLPIVIASGQTVAEMHRRFQTPPSMAFLSKPYEFEHLLSALESLAGGGS